VNITENSELANKFEVQSYPALLFFKKDIKGIPGRVFEYEGKLIFLPVYLFFFYFFCAPGHIIRYFLVQALYPEPCTRPYGIRIYLHSSALRALTASRFRPTRPATVVGKACFITF
jgi:hypothetical protein